MVSLTNYSLSIGEKEANIVYTEEFAIKTANDYKNFILTTDDIYLVFYRDDKKCDMLAVHLALEGTLCHNIKLTYVGWFQIKMKTYWICSKTNQAQCWMC